MKIPTKDGFQLNAIYRQGNLGKLVIFAHGMTVDLEDEEIFVVAEREFQKHGFSTLRFDFRAHGASSGEPVTDFTPSGELVDLEAIFSFAKEQGYSWIGLAGASFGGSIASLYAGSRSDEIQKLLLANPILDYGHCFLKPTTPWGIKTFSNVTSDLKGKGFVSVGSRNYSVGQQFFQEVAELEPRETLKGYTNPLLLIHGDADTYIPCEDTVKCFRALANSQKRLEIIKGAEHGFDEEPFTSAVAELVVEFFSS